MAEEEFCSNCTQKSDCKAVYEHLGRSSGPNVFFKVVKAFLLPIAVFIAGLVVFEELFAGIIRGESARTAVSFLLSVCISFFFILIVKAIEGLSAGTKDSCALKGDKDRS
jgi:hypothetical protein